MGGIMKRFLFDVSIVVEAKDLDEAKDIIYKLINAQLPREIAEKVVHFEWFTVEELED